MEQNASLKIENGNSARTPSVNQVAQSALNDSLETNVYLLNQSLQNSQLQCIQLQTGSNSIKNIKRSRSVH